MERNVIEILDNLINRYPILSVCKEDILSAYNILQNSYTEKGKLLICGNGGSAADAEHIVGELMKGFVKKRELATKEKEALTSIDSKIGETLSNNLQSPLRAIALDGHFALTTAYINDCDPYLCFAQQVYGYGDEGDVLLCISTSGNSKNVIYAAVTAKSKGLKVIGLTGSKDSKLSNIADVCIKVPELETYKIQELHLPVYHCLCMMLEEYFFT